MPVFFVHDVNHGIVKPLDRKFRVREINPVQSMSETQAIHPEDAPNTSDFQSVYSNANENQQQTPHHQEHSQKAIQSYQENIPRSPKLSLGKVKDIMSQPVIQIYAEQSLDTAWKLMQENQIHHLIVVNEQAQYCGLISETDIIPYLMRFAKNIQTMKPPEDLALAYFCDHNLLSTHPETELYDLGIAMMEYGLDAVAVTEGAQVIGIVTKSDIFKVILKHQTFEALA